MKARILLGIAFACLGPAALALDWAAAGNQWWNQVRHLASDEMQGRNVGSPGFEEAARYVSGQFSAAGLSPGGTAEWFQPVKLTETAINVGRSKLELLKNGLPKDVPVPAEAQLGYSPDAAASFRAPIVFAGYGLVIPEADHDDLRGLPVRGAVIAYLTGGPATITGNLRSHYSSLEERWKACRAAGALGLISIPNPSDMEIPWARQAASYGMPRMALAGSKTTHGLKFSASWNPADAEDLFAGSGRTFSEVLEAATESKHLPHLRLTTSIQANVATSTRDVSSENVVGIRRGSDLRLEKEYVVISAHLDHLGVGKPVNGDAIYNGAMDDASGVASLIEIAKSLQHTGTQTKRSLVFLAVTAEEKGELGSKYFADHPTFSGRIIADLNMDMFLPLFPLKWLEVQGLNESTLGDDIRAVAEAAGVKVQADKEPNHNRFIRSDQYSFIKKGVPALAFKFGYVPGAPEEKIFKDWYTQRYHGVGDDVNQPVDAAAAAQFDSILEKLSVRVADGASVPEWKPDSFFRRFAATGQ
jgi:hypothetical protein